MSFWIPMAAGAGLGLLKAHEQSKQARKQNELNAAYAENSPWLKMNPMELNQTPGLPMQLAEGAATGAGMFSQFGKGDWDKLLANLQTPASGEALAKAGHTGG